ncbi:MtnX-like HAD-IB family phosphatase [Stigmatella sp. ncwal1]|uniref:MtnX-like HAD-IB family phosphatase n=1 Tax=Stigmatella ashevillensis TaxID=2995309 RepID=A0ABT5DN56_9BACT|nr:MtnX-like HAD-IB family phosphatase [Stigmatella ashevillena]MDC0714568.1 MtnX-like HAD-IB family phosphatase [Stigmatella ashevillena]
MRLWSNPIQGAAIVVWDIFCDFDGTIVLRDVIDSLLEHFAPPEWREIEQEWKHGRICSRERLARQVPLLEMSRAELDQQLDRIELDPGFPAFLQEVRAGGHRLIIISDGLDYAIHRILSRHTLTDIPFFSNVLQQRSERAWQLAFPHFDQKCSAGAGHCKCLRIKRSRWETVSSRPCLLIGDDASDFCAAQKADSVFAKKTLIDHCVQRGLPHHPIQGFADARRLFPSLAQRLPATLFPLPVRRDPKKYLGA